MVRYFTKNQLEGIETTYAPHSKIEYPIYYCDKCGKGFWEATAVQDIRGVDLCFDCLLEELDTVKCESCGEESEEYLYRYNGKILCCYCIAKKIGIETVAEAV